MDITTIMRRLFLGSALKTISLCCSVAAALFLMPFLIHSLGDRNYGVWVLVGTFTGYYGLVDLGLGAAIGRFISRAIGRNDIQEINVIANTSLCIYAVLGTIVLVASTAIAFTMPFFVEDKNEAVMLTKMLILTGLTVGLQFPVRVAGGILQSHVRHDLLAYAGFIELSLKLALTYHFISKGYGLLSLAVISLGVGIIEYITEFVFMKRSFPSFRLNRKYIDTSRIKELFQYSLIAVTGYTTKTVRLTVVPFVTVGLVGINFVVLFAVAQRLIEYFQQLIENSLGMLYTVFSQLEGQNNVEAIRKGFQYTTVMAILISLYVGIGIVVYGEQFIKIWLGDQYNQAFYLIIILLVPVIVSLIQAPCMQVLYGISQHKYCAIIYSLELILIILGGIGVGWMYGIYGIAIGVALGIVIPELALPFVMCKVLKIRFFELYGEIIIPFFTRMALAMSCVIFIRDYVTPSYLSLVVWNIGQLIVMCPILFMILPRDLRNAIVSTLFHKHSPATV